MYKAIIIDDEPLAQSLIEEFLLPHSQIQVVEKCPDGFQALKAIQQHQPHLLFLDVQMPKITGFELLELLPQPPAVIFTTAFDEYALKAFDANAIDYLLKPINKERFDKAIHTFLKNVGNNTTANATPELPHNYSDNQRIVVKNGSEIKIVPLTELAYIEAYDDYVKIHTANDCYLKKQTLSHYENALSTLGFVRVHRSYLLNTSFLTRIAPMEKEQYIAVLKDNTQLPMSRTGYAKLKEVLGL